ncbi:hypothetical protein AAHH67_05265 [Niallia circulans]
MNLEVIFIYTNLEVINKNSYEMKLTWTNKVVGIMMLLSFVAEQTIGDGLYRPSSILSLLIGVKS